LDVNRLRGRAAKVPTKTKLELRTAVAPDSGAYAVVMIEDREGATADIRGVSVTRFF